MGNKEQKKALQQNSSNSNNYIDSKVVIFNSDKFVKSKNSKQNDTDKKSSQYQKDPLQIAEEQGGILEQPKPDLNFQKAIMQARNAKKMTQKQLAQQLQIPQNLYQKYENGSSVPNNKDIAKMERYLNCRLPRNK